MMIGNHRPNININVIDPPIRFAHFRFLDKIAIKIISAAAAIELCKLCLIYLFFFLLSNCNSMSDIKVAGR